MEQNLGQHNNCSSICFYFPLMSAAQCRGLTHSIVSGTLCLDGSHDVVFGYITKTKKDYCDLNFGAHFSWQGQNT